MPDYKLYNENCTDGMKRIESESIDLVVTSPPYDDLRMYTGYSFDFESVAQELYRVIKPGGVVVWIVSDATQDGSETGTSFKQALYFKEIGFNIHDTMIWRKDSFAFPESTRYYPVFEYMFIFSKGKPKSIHLIADRQNKYVGCYVHGTERQRDGSLKIQTGLKNGKHVKETGCRFNVWDISGEKNNKSGHPAVFPRAIARDHIISWSNRGDIVLDPFSGSGTTAIEAVNQGRDFIGFEISKEYYDKSIERINRETAQINIFNYLAESEG